MGTLHLTAPPAYLVLLACPGSYSTGTLLAGNAFTNWRAAPGVDVVVGRDLRSTRTMLDDSTLVYVEGQWDVSGLVQFLMSEASAPKAVSRTPV